MIQIQFNMILTFSSFSVLTNLSKFEISFEKISLEKIFLRRFLFMKISFKKISFKKFSFKKISFSRFKKISFSRFKKISFSRLRIFFFHCPRRILSSRFLSRFYKYFRIAEIKILTISEIRSTIILVKYCIKSIE